MYKTTILFLFCISFCHAEVVKIGMEINPNPPYVMPYNEHWSERPGLYIDLIERAASNIEVQIEFVARPWKRVLAEVKSGQLDAAVGSSYTSERALYGLYPQSNGILDPAKSIGERAYSLYQRTNTPQLWDGKNFKGEGKLFGVMRSYAVVEELRHLGLNLVEVGSQKTMIAMLLKGRIDAIIDLDSYIDHQLKNSPELANKIIKVYPPVRHRPYFLMFSKSFGETNMPLVENFWDEIERVKKSKYYKELQQSYLLMLEKH